MNTDERPGLNTPPFGSNDRPIGGYTAADFPAPAGVPPLTEMRPGTAVAHQPRRRLGTIVAATALAAVVGAGAGVGSYVTLVAGAGPVAAPISVNTLPASQSPQPH